MIKYNFLDPCFLIRIKNKNKAKIVFADGENAILQPVIKSLEKY